MGSQNSKRPSDTRSGVVGLSGVAGSSSGSADSRACAVVLGALTIARVVAMDPTSTSAGHTGTPPCFHFRSRERCNSLRIGERLESWTAGVDAFEPSP